MTMLAMLFISVIMLLELGYYAHIMFTDRVQRSPQSHSQL